MYWPEEEKEEIEEHVEEKSWVVQKFDVSRPTKKWNKITITLQPLEKIDNENEFTEYLDITWYGLDIFVKNITHFL